MGNLEKVVFGDDFFYFAMVGLIGRTPDFLFTHGVDGFYEFMYCPENDNEEEDLIEAVEKISRWLDLFDIKFSETMCQYGSDPWEELDGEGLIIRVKIKTTN